MDVREIISSGLLELYVSGLASDKERTQVEQWMQHYPMVAAEVASIEKAIEAMAHARAISPGTEVKSKIFEAIDALQIPAETEIDQTAENTALGTGGARIVRPIWKWVAAASFLALVASGALNLFFYQQNHLLNEAISQARQDLKAAATDRDRMQDDLSVVQSRYSEAVMLNGVNETPDAVAKIFWVKNTGDVFIDPSNLPSLPQGQQFQLWAIIDGKPLDAGLILTREHGTRYHIQKMKSFGRAQAFAITIEKEGGSATPTLNKMVVMGKL